MKVIQVCGTNGTGKTTLVKGLLAGGNFLRMKMPLGDCVKEWWFDGKVAVIGKYGKNNCCGVDTENYTGEQLLCVLSAILSQIKPNAVVFEDVRFGGSYIFKQKAKKIAESHGYEFVVVALTASLKTISERVIGRTGNPNVNFDNMLGKAKCVIRSTNKIKDDGAETYLLDTEQLNPQQVLVRLRKLAYG